MAEPRGRPRPGSAVSICASDSLPLLTRVLGGLLGCPHFTGEETEARRSEATWVSGLPDFKALMQ